MAKKAGGTTNKAEALRKSLEVNGWTVSNEAHQQYLRDQFNVEMSLQQISQYKSVERRRSGKRRRRKGRAGAEAAAATPAGGRGDANAILQFVSAIRTWEEKLGSKKVLDVIGALYNKKG